MTAEEVSLTQGPSDTLRDEATAQAASLIAQALVQLQTAKGDSSGPNVVEAGQELRLARTSLEELARGLERQLEEDKDQRRVLGDQLTTLAGSLDRLVTHLQDLSHLMADLLERLAQPAPEPRVGETPFAPGGEGITLVLGSVPGFQGLMEIQKGLTGMEQVAGASVERYQEGESRILLHLKAHVTASEITEAIQDATGFAAIVEESKPELFRLRLKIIPGAR